MTFLVDIVKMIIAAITSIILFVLAIALFAQGNWIAALIILIIAVIYAFIALMNGRIVRLSEETVQLKLFGIKWLTFNWSEIQEVGVTGVKVLKSKTSKRTGTKYIYFSPKEMTDDERFKMCFSWPPKGIIYIRFNSKRIKKISGLWKKEITLYNTAGLSLED